MTLVRPDLTTWLPGHTSLEHRPTANSEYESHGSSHKPNPSPPEFVFAPAWRQLGQTSGSERRRQDRSGNCSAQDSQHGVRNDVKVHLVPIELPQNVVDNVGRQRCAAAG